MKKLTVSASVIALIISLLGGCSWTQHDTGMVSGAVVGGAAGALVTGGNPAGTVAGVIGGGYVGRRLTQ